MCHTPLILSIFSQPGDLVYFKAVLMLMLMTVTTCFIILLWSTTRPFSKCGLNYCDICGIVFVWNITNISLLLWDRNGKQCYCHTIDKSHSISCNGMQYHALSCNTLKLDAQRPVLSCVGSLHGGDQAVSDLLRGNLGRRCLCRNWPVVLSHNVERVQNSHGPHPTKHPGW